MKERLVKLLILGFVLFIVGVIFKAGDESFSGYDVIDVSGDNYITENEEKLLYFQDESSGLYFVDTDKESSTKFFSYSITNGKMSLTFLESDKTMTLYFVKSGLYSQTQNIYYYKVK